MRVGTVIREFAVAVDEFLADSVGSEFSVVDLGARCLGTGCLGVGFQKMKLVRRIHFKVF